MATKQKQDSVGKDSRPIRKIRSGRFQVSLWSFRRLLSNGGAESVNYIEQWVDVDRACVQYSAHNKTTGQWDNQSIWCSVDDLRSLASVIDQLNHYDNDGDDEDEDNSSSPESEVAGFPHLAEDKTEIVR